jgi:hypothetical protein
LTYGTPTRGVAVYDLCWAFEQGTNSSDHVLVGSLTVAGPYDGDYACTLGLPCSVELDGIGLTDANNFAFASSADCVESERRTQAEDARRLDGHYFILGTASSGTYDFGLLSADAGDYTACWQAASDTPYLNVGTFRIRGPTIPQQQKCLLGRPCRVRATGFGVPGY